MVKAKASENPLNDDIHDLPAEQGVEITQAESEGVGAFFGVYLNGVFLGSDPNLLNSPWFVSGDEVQVRTCCLCFGLVLVSQSHLPIPAELFL